MSRRKGFAGVSFFSFQDIVTSVLGIFMLIMMILVVEFIEKQKKAGSASKKGIDKQLLASLDELRDHNQALEIQIRETKDISNNEMNSFQIAELTKELSSEIEFVRNQLRITNEQNRQLEEAVAELQKDATTLAELSAKKDTERNELRHIDEQLKKLRSTAQKFKDEDSLVFRQSQTSGRSIVVVDFKPSGIEVLRMAIGQREKLANHSIKNFSDWLRKQDIRSSHYLFFVRPGAADEFQDLNDYAKKAGYSYGFDAVPADLRLNMFEEIEAE